jgi:hypothetical protein
VTGLCKAKINTESPKKAMLLRQTYKVVIFPMNLLESTPPNVSSPFVTDAEVEVVGSKDTATKFSLIVPCSKRLSVTVGMRVLLSGLKELYVRSLGPILQKKSVFGTIGRHIEKSMLTPKSHQSY